uniref:Altered inheritance of mitochondria protein 6 n=1 Tax=Coccidioides posadasii RMSCC 3488 TaxID=454284 RepID=A0A0J6F7V3_COCPO|nr:secreted protein [Coccidioides posadasii RMSCC 3488]
MPPSAGSTASLDDASVPSEPLLDDDGLSTETPWWYERGIQSPLCYLRWIPLRRRFAQLALWLRSGDEKGDLEQSGFNDRRRLTLSTTLCFCRRSRRVRLLLFIILGGLTMLGLVQLISLLSGVFVSFFPSYIDRNVDLWGKTGDPSEYLAHRPTDQTADIRPVACHSHNDYWRQVPLYSSIKAGCISVEADVWLFDNDLYVGHTKSSLAINRTLTSLYLDPLLTLLAKQNPVTRFQPGYDGPPHGIFDTKPFQTLVLLVDFKTNGHDIWPYLTSQLSPFREKGYLTYFNGTTVIERPITVVATGNAPFDLVVANSTHRDIFFDAPLAELAASDSSVTHASIPYDFRNSYYASVSFHKSIGFPWRFQLSEKQLYILRAQIKGAHDRGLKVRYWDSPAWPYSLRNQIWTELVREGVDILNVDDLKSATGKDWTRI